MEKCKHSFKPQDGGFAKKKQVEILHYIEEKHKKIHNLLDSCEDKQKLTERQKEDIKELGISGSYGVFSAKLKMKLEKKEKDLSDDKSRLKTSQTKLEEESSKRTEKRDGA
jgi:hypothetical protein